MENSNKVTLSSIKKYFPAGITAFIVLAFSIIFFFTFFKIGEISEFFGEIFVILEPIVFGLIFAYILNPISAKIEKWILLIPKNKKKDKLVKNTSTARGISIFVSVVLALLILFVLANLIVPQLVSSVTILISDMPSKIDAFLAWVGNILGGDNQISKIVNDNIVHIIDMFENWVENNLLATLQTSLSFFLVKTFDVVSVLLNVVVGIIVSIYVIFSKEKFTAQAKKLFYAVLKPKKANVLLDILRQSNKIFSGFITGKIIDSLIIGVICFIVMSVLRMPYTLLISVIVGVTNVIPFFGPFIGAIPSAFLLLLVDPIECLYFIVLIIVLQQLDGNVIGPKILGDSTGLSAFWVVFAILLFGGLFGFMGMLIGVPVFAVIYYLINRYISYVLRKNSLPVDTKEYENLEYITESGEVKHLS